MAHRACGLLLWATVLGIAAAGRRHDLQRGVDWTPAQPTGTRTPAGLTKLQVSHRPTQAPSLATWADLRRRESDPAICGYFSGLAEPLVCGDGYTCTNVGDHRDCCYGGEFCTAVAAFSTECVDWDHEACSTSRPGTSCCSLEYGYPFCRTYLWSTSATPGRSFSIYVCEDRPMIGVGTMLAEPPTSLIDQFSTRTRSTHSSETMDPGSLPASGDTRGGDGSTPVGAIIGGVVGGLAIIGIVVLGIFFMFFRSRRIEGRDNEAEASVPFAKPEPSPTSGPSSPDLDMSQADEDSATSKELDDSGQRQPLMTGISRPESELEGFPTVPAKARIYTELPTQLYKSELPA
ncbi:hypothetical protein MMYC01_203183 [Madurella mycetomatis]|uniref:Carcinoembryonic antigen-related cell adhesion molecule 1 n=1 Tax=Madurella mycetomatis TaxID=100816 RepID=A0A175WC96_9PEZI|nr:hypothetical protein MMYC01_203183 [Madurella mycetomatis]